MSSRPRPSALFFCRWRTSTGSQRRIPSFASSQENAGFHRLVLMGPRAERLLQRTLHRKDSTRPPVAWLRSAVPAGVDALTERERDVLALLARGLSNRRIGERLAISENTVKAHVGAVLAKLGAATRTEAVAIGIRLGLVVL